MKKEVAVNGAAEEDGIRELANWLIEHRHRGMEETPPPCQAGQEGVSGWLPQ